MPIRKLRAGRVPGVTAEQYVGTHGTIFYDEILGTLRISDGVTAGGNPLTLVASDFAFQFGDFIATTPGNGAATLSSKNFGQDIDIVSNDDGIINVVGNFHVHTTASYDPNDPDANGAIFRVDQQGKVRMLVPDANAVEGAITIVGSLSGLFQAPVNTGVMLHITGQLGVPGIPSRIYNDAQNAFAAFVARRYNGTALNPTAVLADEELMRISGTAHNGTTIPGSGNQRIVYKALGNQTTSNQGGYMELWATPQDTTTIAKVATIDNANGITSTKFTGPLTGNVTGKADTAGNADTVTNGVYTSGDQTINGTKTFGSKITGSISGNADGTAGVATTVTLVATNTTDATHYLTFVDTATGNENVRTDSGLTYNPGTNKLVVGAINTKLFRNSRDAGTIATNGTLTIDFSTDDLVYCVWGDGMNIAYQNYTAGSVVRLLATKATGTGTDSISLDGVTASHVSTGSTTVASQADVTVFIEFTCVNTTLGSVYVKL